MINNTIDAENLQPESRHLKSNGIDIFVVRIFFFLKKGKLSPRIDFFGEEDMN